MGGGILPKEYQQVEWIGSSGTQYIDTGIIPNNNTKWELVQAINTITWGNKSCGCTLGPYNNQVFAIEINGNNNFYIACAGSYNTGLPFDYNPHTFVIDALNQKGAADEYEVAFGGTLAYSDRSIYLFSIHYKSGAQNSMKSNIYSSKLYEGGELIQDLVPCYRKSDGEIGMYDLIEKTFFTNQGTGIFTKGPEV